MERLLRDQFDLEERMNRTVVNLKKLGTKRINSALIEASIQSLNDKWKKFEEIYERLRHDHWEELRESKYHKSNALDRAEEIFLSQKADLMVWREALEGAQSKEAAPRTVVPGPARASLPKVHIPAFSGWYEDWPEFRDLFQSLIIEDLTVSDVSRFHYLKSSLKGDAQQLLRQYQLTAENFAPAWDRLCEFYENKRLLTLPRTGTVGSLAGINRPITSSEDLFVFITVEMLDIKSRKEWESVTGESATPPSYEDLRRFMEKRLHTLKVLQPEKSSWESKASERVEKPRKNAADRKAFVLANGLCLNCLSRHRVVDYLSRRTCTVCDRKHHTALHDACRAEITESGESLSGALAHQVSHEPHERIAVLLATARVAVRDEFGVTHHVRALIDQGSEMSLVTESLVQRLRLPREKVSLAIFGVGGRQTGVARGRTFLPRFCDQTWCGGRDPIAQETSIGWIVSGPVGHEIHAGARSVMCCAIGDSLSRLVRRFWEQEELPLNQLAVSAEDVKCEEFFENSHSRNASGRYIVRIPVREAVPNLTGTRTLARRALSGVERRFAREPEFKRRYVEFMREYELLGHMSPASDVSKSMRACFLSHHGVFKGSGPTAKLRVVFNGPAALTGGSSLNGSLLAGSNLLPTLADVLLQWRRHAFVFSADIEKMYRQVEVHPDDHDLQRILWRECISQPVKEYRLNTVTYGLTSAPFLAIRALRQLARDEGARFPLGAKTLVEETYVDDILSGGESVEEAFRGICELRGMCSAGGIPLKKWVAYDVSLLEHIPAADLSVPGVRSWDPEVNHAALGLQWHPKSDDFSFSMRVQPAEIISKRTVLAQAAQLFDLLGWLAPVVVRAKIFIQGLWLKRLDWDAALDRDDEIF
ncbi:uncharacterized protein [Cardiocondyla obscurior]|uniref:uncharacterized protein n=1 Tax=Cardiocondyla obscurior TaxID=286306 RepID=UPI0039656A20